MKKEKILQMLSMFRLYQLLGSVVTQAKLEIRHFDNDKKF